MLWFGNVSVRKLSAVATEFVCCCLSATEEWYCERRVLSVIIYALLTKREVKMAGYWPSSFFAFLWTETKSRSIKTQKKNEANIQPS